MRVALNRVGIYIYINSMICCDDLVIAILI